MTLKSHFITTTNYLKQLTTTVATIATSAETYSKLQTGASQLASNYLSTKLPLEKKSITVDLHPLQSFYPLLENAVRQQQQIPDLRQRLEAIPEKLRRTIYIEMNDFVESGEEVHLFYAIKNVIERILDAQEQPTKNAIFETIYRLAGQPRTEDIQWGEHGAKDDTLRLIRALHRHHRLEIPGKEIAIYTELEKDLKQPSCLFHLYRKELDSGCIGLHNGICSSLDDVKKSAYHISDRCGQGHNIYCTYSATVDVKTDFYSAALGQGKISTPGVFQLLERWNDYFEQDQSHPLLQICHSRGAIEVYNALMHLPEEKRRRIIVIAVAPACFIPNTDAKKVVNLVIPSDFVPKVALHRHIPNPNTRVLDEHEDGKSSHLLLGSSYLNALALLIDSYIRTNDV